MQFYLKDPKTGEPSVTLTLFVTGTLVAVLKLLLSGITIKGFAMSTFSGVDFAAAVAALGGVYTLRRQQSESKSE